MGGRGDGRCGGVLTHDGNTVSARGVILASGGAAALWSRTTNPPGAFGSGLLLALAAGAPLADLELMQFHPTAVVDPRRTDSAGHRRRSVEGFLITEAIRGEGAILLGADGERFRDARLQPVLCIAAAIPMIESRIASRQAPCFSSSASSSRSQRSRSAT